MALNFGVLTTQFQTEIVHSKLKKKVSSAVNRTKSILMKDLPYFLSYKNDVMEEESLQNIHFIASCLFS